MRPLFTPSPSTLWTTRKCRSLSTSCPHTGSDGRSLGNKRFGGLSGQTTVLGLFRNDLNRRNGGSKVYRSRVRGTSDRHRSTLLSTIYEKEGREVQWYLIVHTGREPPTPVRQSSRLFRPPPSVVTETGHSSGHSVKEDNVKSRTLKTLHLGFTVTR